MVSFINLSSSHILAHLLGHVQTYALSQVDSSISERHKSCMFYGFDLFFDFAGYSIFALAASIW